MNIAEQSATLQGGARETGSLRRTVLFVVIALIVGGFAGRFVFLSAPSDTVAANAPPAGGVRNLVAAQASLSEDPENPALLVNVGLAALDEARRTADPALYAVSDEAITRARKLAPDDIRTIVPAGLLALARHDFTGALELARMARELAPLAVDPLAVEVDALVELGRYDEALTQAELMVTRKPNSSSIPRLSYVLELRGDAQGALETMQQAVAASGGRNADGAYILSLLGDLQVQAGRLDAAEGAYARALAALPGQVQSEYGMARVEAYRGDLKAASTRLGKLTERIPLPDAVALYADVLAASGDETRAAEQRTLVRAIEDLNRSQGGISVDLELAKFEASHAKLAGGDPAGAVRLAESARAGRPTIFGDDTLAWALRQAGRPAEGLVHARAATRLGTEDASLWWHLAAIEADLGMTAEARTHLERSRSISPFLALNEQAEANALATTLGL